MGKYLIAFMLICGVAWGCDYCIEHPGEKEKRAKRYSPEAVCSVMHQDENGNQIPCPGYPEPIKKYNCQHTPSSTNEIVMCPDCSRVVKNEDGTISIVKVNK